MEKLIAMHCAPALAGIKPANLVTIMKSEFKNFYQEIKRLNCDLNAKDIYIEILCECNERVLLMIYRKAVLQKHLENEKNREFLEKYGYGGAEGLSDYFEILKRKLEGDFPHEIGIFLGYPIEDIYSFINHPRDGCLLCGEWKVYHNRDEAEKIFRRFNACRYALMKRVAAGKSLAQIFCAA